MCGSAAACVKRKLNRSVQFLEDRGRVRSILRCMSCHRARHDAICRSAQAMHGCGGGACSSPRAMARSAWMRSRGRPACPRRHCTRIFDPRTHYSPRSSTRRANQQHGVGGLLPQALMTCRCADGAGADAAVSAGGPKALAIHRVVMAESVRFPELGRAFYENGPRAVPPGIRCTGWRRRRGGAAGRCADPSRAADQFVGMLRDAWGLAPAWAFRRRRTSRDRRDGGRDRADFFAGLCGGGLAASGRRNEPALRRLAGAALQGRQPAATAPGVTPSWRGDGTYPGRRWRHLKVRGNRVPEPR